MTILGKRGFYKPFWWSKHVSRAAERLERSLGNPTWHRPLYSFVPVEDLRSLLAPPDGNHVNHRGTLWKIHMYGTCMEHVYENDGKHTGIIWKDYHFHPSISIYTHWDPSNHGHWKEKADMVMKHGYSLRCGRRSGSLSNSSQDVRQQSIRNINVARRLNKYV